MTFEEWSARLKEQWWRLNSRQFFSIKVKKTCYQCGAQFTCEDCYIEYWLCSQSTDWKLKKECLCAKCLKAMLNAQSVEAKPKSP